jgi:hypothetical protein
LDKLAENAWKTVDLIYSQVKENAVLGMDKYRKYKNLIGLDF